MRTHATALQWATKNFLKDGPLSACPVCSSDDLREQTSETGDGNVYVCVECKTCHTTWTEVYYPGAVTELKIEGKEPKK